MSSSGQHSRGTSFPLHRLVWAGDAAVLRTALSTGQHDLEAQDLHKRTPFRLAVALDRLECAKVLVEFGCDTSGADGSGWTAVHDATCTRDAKLLHLVLEQRNKSQRNEAQQRIPQLLQMLESDEDFYVEMAWDFSSWVPFVSRMCPSDVYRIWKRGSCVRVDTTLLGYSNLRWLRGHRSFIFQARRRDGTSGAGGGGSGAAGGAGAEAGSEGSAGAARAVDFEMVQVDHDRKVALQQDVMMMDASRVQAVSEEEIQDRLGAPITVTTMDTEAIGFSRAKAGIWGFQSDKTEKVGDVEAKVYNVSGIELVTKTRFEHLPREHPARRKGRSAFSQMMSGMMGSRNESEEVSGLLAADGSPGDGEDGAEEGADGGGSGGGGSGSSASGGGSGGAAPRFCATPEEYFRHSTHPVVVGRAREQREQRQVFKAQLWMSEDFPLSLQRQVLPIVDLMAPTSQHIAKLRDFISLQLPTGFPVKIEIPVYHLVNARVTFSNFRREVDPAVFAIPADYAVLRPGSGGAADDPAGVDDDVLLARAMQYSMGDQPDIDDDELLRRVMALSLAESQGQGASVGGAGSGGVEGGSGGKDGAPWECAACTFLNSNPLVRGCEICGTPRPRVPALSGGDSSVGGVPSSAGGVVVVGGAGAPRARGPGMMAAAEEERMLQQAIALSMTREAEDAELQRILELSMKEK